MKHYIALVCCGCCFVSLLFAQPIDLSKLKGMKMRNIGPAGMSGRVTAIDAVHANPEIIYAGTASGGLWKSESGGIDWEPVFDGQPVQSVGAVAIQQSNPNIVWAGTGEGNPRNSQTSGAGIYRSLNGGRSWTLMGLEKTKTIHRIIIHRDDPDVVYVAALGSAWGPNAERGVYKTTDGGGSWEKILYVNDETGCADLVVDPHHPGKLIAAMWEYGRKPWFFNSGGEGSGVYLTVDGGNTWNKRTDKHGLPKGDLGRIGLAIAPSKPNIVYALIEAKKTALYKSTDGGYQWKKVTDKNVGNRPFYYADIYVDPKNENRIYNLYSVVSKSEDGGKTFSTFIPWSAVHPDHHAFWIHPDNPEFIIDGNDGGLNISRDRGKSWRFVENLPIAQFYHINIDMATPYNVYGGMQDNGSWKGPGYVWKYGSITNSDWQELYFGDGFDVVPKNGDSRFGYAMSQGGNVIYYDNLTGYTKFIQPVHPENKTLRFNWNAAVAQDPFNPCGVYFGSQYVHKSMDCGSSWTIISPDLTTNDTTRQKQAQSGGLTIDATRAENFTTILAIAPSPLNDKVIWVGTDDGNLQVTEDGGDSWTNVTGNIRGVPAGSWIAQIEVSQHQAGEAIVVINNYRRNDWKPYLFHTRDYGRSWTSIVSEEQVDGHTLSVVQDPKAANLLFLGTENGLYVTIDGGTNWTKWDADYPSVSTTDLKIHPREDDLIIGTFGRSAWILDDIRPLRAIAREGTGLLNKPFHVFDPPDAVLAEYASFQGVRFAAHAAFKGDNRQYGAMISFWSKQTEKEKEDKPDEGKEEPKKSAKKHSKKVSITILDSSRDTVRVFTVKPDTGLNRIHWMLNRNGERYPSYSDPKPDSDLPSGGSVNPGRYTIHVSYKEYTDSTSVRVLADQRISQADAGDTDAREKMLAEHRAIVKAATTAFNRLKEAKKTIKMIDKQAEGVKVDSVKKQVVDKGKNITDSLTLLMELFLQPKDFNGYDHVTQRINSYLYGAGSYIYSSNEAPGNNAETYLEHAKKAVEEALVKINDFFATQWEVYQRLVESVDMPQFIPYDPIKID